MPNHFREQMDAGLKTLADNQGKNGLPSAPAAASPHVNADGTARTGRCRRDWRTAESATAGG
ncbi:MAG TPA: hypothetical protein VIX11_10800 [Candidatus Acidoferrum sp.]